MYRRDNRPQEGQGRRLDPTQAPKRGTDHHGQRASNHHTAGPAPRAMVTRQPIEPRQFHQTWMVRWTWLQTHPTDVFTHSRNSHAALPAQLETTAVAAT